MGPSPFDRIHRRWPSVVELPGSDMYRSTEYTPAGNSTLVTGDWDPETRQGADNTRLYDVIPVVGGVLALGIHEEADGGGAEGNPVPTAGLPAWGRAEPGGPTGLLVHLNRAP